MVLMHKLMKDTPSLLKHNTFFLVYVSQNVSNI